MIVARAFRRLSRLDRPYAPEKVADLKNFVEKWSFVYAVKERKARQLQRGDSLNLASILVWRKSRIQSGSVRSQGKVVEMRGYVRWSWEIYCWRCPQCHPHGYT